MSDPVDPRQSPGSYELRGDGHVRTEENTAPADDVGLAVDAAAARAAIAAGEALGFPAPQHLVDAAKAKAKPAPRAPAKAADAPAPVSET